MRTLKEYRVIMTVRDGGGSIKYQGNRTCADCFLHACWKNADLALAEHQEKNNRLRSGGVDFVPSKSLASFTTSEWPNANIQTPGPDTYHVEIGSRSPALTAPFSRLPDGANGQT